MKKALIAAGWFLFLFYVWSVITTLKDFYMSKSEFQDMTSLYSFICFFLLPISAFIGGIIWTDLKKFRFSATPFSLKLIFSLRIVLGALAIVTTCWLSAPAVPEYFQGFIEFDKEIITLVGFWSIVYITSVILWRHRKIT